MMSKHDKKSLREGARIAIVSHSHPSVSKGGAEIAAYTLYRGLRQLGVDARFISTCSVMDEARLSEASEYEKTIIVRPEQYNHFFHIAPNRTAEILKKILNEEDISFVNFHHFFNFGLQALRGAAQLGIRSVVTLHEFLAICNNHGQMVTRPAQVLCERSSPAACSTCFPDHTRQQFALRKRLFLEAFSQCEAFVSPSNFLASRFVEWGLPAGRIHVIENGIAGFCRQNSPPKAPSDTWTFGYFGQINPFKGVDVLLEAAQLIERQTPNSLIRFRIHGNLIGNSDDFAQKFNAMVSKGGRVSWAGPYDNSSVGRLMSDCDYLLVPSRWWENSPVVIQEAFGVGLPVICSGIGGMAEKVIDGVSGLHFRVNDPGDLVRVMLYAANEHVHEKLRQALPDPYRGEDMAESYLAAIDALTAP